VKVLAQGNSEGLHGGERMVNDVLTERLVVGTGGAAREIAYKHRSATKSDAGPGLVWLGGFRSDMTGTKAMVIDALGEQRGLEVTRFDYSGHGVSGGRFEDGTISRWLEESLAVVDTVTSGDQILVGSSMGGWIALLLTRALRKRENPSRIKGLVLIAPAADFTERLMWAHFPEAIRTEIMSRGRYDAPSAYSADPYPITRDLIEDGRNHLLLDGPIDLGCHVHILQGREDPDVPWQHAELLMERLVYDDVRLTYVRDGDHRLSRPQDLDLLTRVTEAMVEAVTADARIS
jgi:pimeloyl-ACP methyl ester carboxylesterase